ncbi:MAG: ABC transporter ATP-binding protein [Clostridia bacterium]|nr:ABC transporter ATP-binding protein [Clostridia bacterium]
MKNNFLGLLLKNIFVFLGALVSALLLTKVTINGLDIISKSIDNLLSGNKIIFVEFIIPLVIYTIIAVICAFVKVYFSRLYAVKIMRDLRNLVVKKLISLEYSYYDDNGSGKLSTGLLNDVNIIQHFLSEMLPEIFITIINVMIMLIYIFNINKWLLAAIALSYPFVFLAVKIISRRVLELAKKRRHYIDIESSEVYDIFGGMDIVKSYNLYDIMLDRIKKAMLNIFGVEVKRAKITSVMEAARMLLKWIPSIICLSFGAVLVIRNDITTGQLMAFVLVTERAFEQFSSLPYYINEAVDSLVSIERIEELLRAPDEKAGGIKELNTGENAVELNDIVFKYGDNTLFNGLSLKIKRGEKVGIVGSSGSGKSTLFKLLCGLYTPLSGSYKLFDTDFHKIDIKYAREKIALISQDVFLFPASIRENVSYGNDNAEFEEIEKACKLANIHDFIINLPKGYETEAGERGVKLSGGERQRLSLARAYLKNAELLLMDEPTSALDTNNEKLMNEVLKNMSQNTTVVIIAHRLSTVVNCDNIFVIENGSVCEEGTHNVLINKKGRYCELYNSTEGGNVK